VLTFQRSNLCINDKKLSFIRGMEPNVVGDSCSETLLGIALFAQNALQAGIQALHVGLHNLNEQCLLTGIMIVNTRGLNTCHTGNVT